MPGFQKTTKLEQMRLDNDNDNDNDTLREVPHLSHEGLALQARVQGSHDTTKKNLLYC